MLEGKFKDKTHPRCGYPLWKVQPTNIVWLGTQYVAKCPRCFFNLPVIDVVDPDAPLEPEPSPEPEVAEPVAEPVAEQVVKPRGRRRASKPEPEVEPEPALEE